MKKITPLILAAVAAVFFAACTPPATNVSNAPSNTTSNANTAKPTSAAPTADALMALDKQANDAYFKSDSSFFEGFLSDKFVMYQGGNRMDKATIIKMIGAGKCDVKPDYKLEDPQMATIDADTAVLSYKGTFDGTCNRPDGKPMKVPSPVRAATVWVRSGDKWLAVFHGETPIVDPMSPPKPAAKPAERDPKGEAKKEMPKKDEMKKDEKGAANSNSAANKSDAPAKAAADANTDALVKVELSGWEAWKAKDAKKLDDFTAKNASGVGAEGKWFGNHADLVKYWAEMPCENVKNVSVTDGFASALSPTVEMLTLKGTADGTCYGQKNGSNHALSIYIKEGDAWKLAFSFSYPM